MASQTLVRRSYDDPKLTYETNVGGTVNLLEALKNVDCSRVIVIVTSDKVYENKEWIWGYRENDRLSGHDPYSTSKACMEIVSKSYYDAFFNEGGKTFLSTVRSGNVIGGGDWSKDRIVPDCIRALKNGHDIPVRSLSSVRPWLHVLDPLSGYLNLASKMWEKGRIFSGSWNFGPKSTSICSVKRLVNQIIHSWGSGSWKDVSLNNQKHETKLLRLNSEKARHYLSWNPIYDYKGAIELTVEWYRYYYYVSEKMMCFTKKQIEKYVDAYLKQKIYALSIPPNIYRTSRIYPSIYVAYAKGIYRISASNRIRTSACDCSNARLIESFFPFLSGFWISLTLSSLLLNPRTISSV